MSIHLNTVGVVVQDMAKSLAFYRLLGLEIPEGAEAEPHVEYVGEHGYAMGFVSQAMVEATDPKWTAGAGHRLNLQFRCDGTADVDRAYERLMAAGYESYVAPWDAFWGQRFARVVDPDGNVVNLFAPLGE